MTTRKIAGPLVGTILALAATPAFAQAVSKEYTFLTFAVFGGIIAVTMWVTYVAAKRTKTAADF